MRHVSWWVVAELAGLVTALKVFAVVGAITALETSPNSWWHYGGIGALIWFGGWNFCAFVLYGMMAAENDGPFKKPSRY